MGQPRRVVTQTVSTTVVKTLCKSAETWCFHTADKVVKLFRGSAETWCFHTADKVVKLFRGSAESWCFHAWDKVVKTFYVGQPRRGVDIQEINS